MRIESREQFETLREEIRAAEAANGNRILVCCGTGCLANGARKVAEAFAEQVGKRNLDAQVKLMVKNTGCHGFCERGPLVVLQPSGVLYTRVRVSNVAQILEKTVENGEIIPRLLYKNPADDIAIEQYSEIPFYKNQTRVAFVAVA
jgi:NADH-quinone oxidoreductase subunit F